MKNSLQRKDGSVLKYNYILKGTSGQEILKRNTMGRYRHTAARLYLICTEKSTLQSYPGYEAKHLREIVGHIF